MVIAKEKKKTDCVAVLRRAAELFAASREGQREKQAAADELASAVGMGNATVLVNAIAKAEQHWVGGRFVVPRAGQRCLHVRRVR